MTRYDFTMLMNGTSLLVFFWVDMVYPRNEMSGLGFEEQSREVGV